MLDLRHGVSHVEFLALVERRHCDLAHDAIGLNAKHGLSAANRHLWPGIDRKVIDGFGGGLVADLVTPDRIPVADAVSRAD